MSRRGLVRELFAEWRSRRAGRRFIKSRLPGELREALGLLGALGNNAGRMIETLERSIDEERRSEVLNASRLGQYPSHSALRRMVDDPSESRRPKR